jgi:uroporphyrin-III C-methyltransferase/precorrin-2 dehydrogenase/sirohydrochlorin ferrochelatase
MGLAILSQELVSHGLSADTPAALIQQGTTERQKVWVSTIAELPALADREQPVAPTMVSISDVVKLHDSLAWFDPSKQV